MILNKIKEIVGWNKNNTEQLKMFSEKIDFKLQKKQIKEKLKTITLSNWALTFTKKWVKNIMILAFSCICSIVLLTSISGKLGIDADVMIALIEFAKDVLKGIIFVFLGYMLKAIYETKWEKQDEIIIKQIENNISNSDENLKGL